MAWSDYSSTAANSWDANAPGSVVSDNNMNPAPDATPLIEGGIWLGSSSSYTSLSINSLDRSYHIVGFDDGYYPSSTPDPIKNNFGTGGGGDPGGGGSTRPTTGMIYPRGQGSYS